MNEYEFFSYYTLIIRYLLPLLAFLVVFRSAYSLFKEQYEGEIWGFLSLPNGSRIPLAHWENTIGRSRFCDVALDYPTLSRTHAAIMRDSYGDWRVYDTGSKLGVSVNGEPVTGKKGLPVRHGNLLELGGVSLVFVLPSVREASAQAESRTKPGRVIRPAVTLFFLTDFQVLLGLQVCVAKGDTLMPAVPLAYCALIALTWLSYFYTRALRRLAFEIETLAFLLCTIGLSVAASSAPDLIYRQLFFLVLGTVLYFVAGHFLRNLDVVKNLRWPIAAAGLILLAVSLLFSETVFGAKNWLSIGSVSFQPSEFVKIAFVFAGASTLDRHSARRNLFLFIVFAAACVGVLAMSGDFGAALIFFVAYLMISYVRSGDFATIFLSVGGAGIAGFLAIAARPHVAARFAIWRHAWEQSSGAGFQQTRTMAAIASGGLFGIGAGNGNFHHVFAADTDMVFGLVSEELGLIVALLCVCVFLILAISATRSAVNARSSFYVVSACAAASIMLFQAILNTLGSVDIMPFTGVTFAFVSRGGSSLIASWILLAFIKAADTRRDASFAVRKT